MKAQLLLLLPLLLGLSASAASAAAPAPPNRTKCEATLDGLEAVCTRLPPSQSWSNVQTCLACLERHPAAIGEGGCSQSTAVAFCYTKSPPAPPTPPPPVLPDGPTKATVSIDLGLRSAPMNRLTMGCHSDSGFASRGRVCHFKCADIHLNVLNNSYDRMYL
jgi:hypothetical protein